MLAHARRLAAQPGPPAGELDPQARQPAAGILAFIFSWNEFSIALNLTTSDAATVPVGIARFAQQCEVWHGEMAAASVLATAPAVLLMFFGQRSIVTGLTLGTLK